MSSKIKSLVIFLILAITFAHLGCSSMDEFSSPSLANQGILPLSATNAYLGTNLYLARQAENSDILYNFLESKGAPVAIEIKESGFKNPRLVLYYPKMQEAYSAELEKHENIYQWIMRGPYAIKRTDFISLNRIQSLSDSDPLFYVNGRLKRFKIDRELAMATPTPLPTATPWPTLTPRPTPKKIKTKTPTAKIITAPSVPQPSIKDFKPLNDDQQAIQMSKGFAERNDKGDIVHTVKSDGQKVESISKWYTESDANKKAILEANNIADGKELVKGQRIRIPIDVLKNLKAMP